MTEDEASIIEALQAEYSALLHAMQSGIEYMKEYNPKLFDPKHARVGIDSALVTSGALVALLIDKGVITEIEYWAALVTGVREEVQRSEAELTARIGKPVRLV